MCCVLILVLVCVLGGLAQVRPPIPPETTSYTCENITEIEFCSRVGYVTASFPNYRNQFTQMEANSELKNFLALAESVCSNAVVLFLCSVYAPFCDPEEPQFRVPPCRELCQHVRDGCEDLVNQFDLTWPPHLECDLYPSSMDNLITFCPDNISLVEIPPNFETNPPPNVTQPSSIPSTQPNIATCPATLNVQRVSSVGGQGHVFAGIQNCSVVCSGIFFKEYERNTVAPVLIIFFALICVIFTVFTVATFLIDRRRFHYPERPIIFLSFCYLVISIAYIVGAISKLADVDKGAFSCVTNEVTSKSYVFQRLPNSETTYKSASCVILFVLVYYFQMASAMWWVVLTFTWFLAAALKWGEEAVEKLWLLYHIIAWSIPAIQVVLVLALRLVDGDQLSGICYTGNANNVGLGVFVFLPLIVYLALGIIFLVIGFTALVNIHRQLQRDPQKSRKLGRLILRIGVYSLLYITPNVILLILYVYELALNDRWELAYARECDATGDCDASVRPSFAAFMFRYIMLFAIGVCSTSWILSSKTVQAWKKFFCSCDCICHNDDTAVHMYDVPDKKNDLSIHGFHHPQTSV